jgi:YHS domain-containing protein
MKVDRATAAARIEIAGETLYFCSESCLHAYEIDPGGDDHPRVETDAPTQRPKTRAASL